MLSHTAGFFSYCAGLVESTYSYEKRLNYWILNFKCISISPLQASNLKYFIVMKPNRHFLCLSRDSTNN